MNLLPNLSPRRRRHVFAAAAVGITGAAIATGATVSASAMGDAPPADADVVTVVSANDPANPGDAISCVFNGDQALAFIPDDAPTPGAEGVVVAGGVAVDADGQPVEFDPSAPGVAMGEAMESETAGLLDADGNPVDIEIGDLATSGSSGGVITGTAGTSASGTASVDPDFPLPDLAASTQGTPEECEALFNEISTHLGN